MRATVEARTAPATEPTQEAAPVPESAAQAATQTDMSDADSAVAYLNKWKERAKQFAQESALLDKKFNSTDVSAVLTAQNLVTRAGLARYAKEYLEGAIVVD